MTFYFVDFILNSLFYKNINFSFTLKFIIPLKEVYYTVITTKVIALKNWTLCVIECVFFSSCKIINAITYSVQLTRYAVANFVYSRIFLLV